MRRLLGAVAASALAGVLLSAAQTPLDPAKLL